jgi:hypothetical protein
MLLPALLLGCFAGRLDASDGIGRMTVAPTKVIAGSSGNTLTFVFTADAGPLRGQTLLAVQRSWTAPQAANPAGAGYVSLDRGSCGSSTRIVRVVGRKILVATACGAGAHYTLTYANATAPTFASDGYVFLTETKPTAKPPKRRGKRRPPLRFRPLADKKQPVVRVVGGPVTQLTVAATSVATAGTAFGITVRALDVYGNASESYRGTVTFTSTDPGATLPAPYAFVAADTGAHAFSGVMMKTAGAQTIHVDDGAGHAADSNPIMVSPFPSA